MDSKNPDQVTQLREIIDRALYRVNTSIPGEIESFDPATQTCSVIPAIQMRTLIDGGESFVDFPPIVNAPIIFPLASTAGFALTLPVRAGDPCIILFAQRAIENWILNGGSQPPEDGVGSRHHDLTDAVVLLAAPPNPDKLTLWEENGIELRNKAKTNRITVRDTEVEIQAGTSLLVLNNDGTVELTAPTSITMNTPLLNVTGQIVSNTSVSDPKGTMEEIRDVYNPHVHPPDVATPDPTMT